MGPIIRKPGDFLKFTNKNPKTIDNYYAYKYLQKRRRYLKVLHHNLISNGYEGTYYPELGIRKVHFTPKNYKDVPSYYQSLISVVTEYFSCRAIWIKRFPKNLIEPINTFIIIGHVPDVYMCSKLLWYEINSIQQLHFNRILQHRKAVKYSHKRRKKNLKGNARTVTSNYIQRLIHNTYRIWERLLEQRQHQPVNKHKYEMIERYCRDNNLLDFGKRNWKHIPDIKHAICRDNRFTPNKLIVYKR